MAENFTFAQNISDFTTPIPQGQGGDDLHDWITSVCTIVGTVSGILVAIGTLMLVCKGKCKCRCKKKENPEVERWYSCESTL